VRVVVFHGYLLRGTGSNVYNARLCAAFGRKGCEVDLLSQDLRPEHLIFVDAIGRWGNRAPEIEILREPTHVTAWRPELGGVLPVYVDDQYEGVKARRFTALSDSDIEDYIARNVAAVRAVCELTEPDIALANHLVMGPVILRRALEGRIPYAVKIHGSALEYVVRPEPERFLRYAREGLDGAAGVLVGSHHIAQRLWETIADPGLPARTRLSPPGVDPDVFHRRTVVEAAEEMQSLVARLRATPSSEPTDAFWRDEQGAATALGRLALDGPDRHVAFVGKLLPAKGIDLLLAAWPLVLMREPRARLVVVGFGDFRAELERLLALLRGGNLPGARDLAVRHRLTYLEGFLTAQGGGDAYRRAAAALRDRVVLTGRLEHDEVATLVSACECQIVPSTFPEAFGMVVAEAAASGALPIAADHSGLAEVTARLRSAVAPEIGDLMSFGLGASVV
jgi:glycosyltransferase involved in cell wall biosynthesis